MVPDVRCPQPKLTSDTDVRYSDEAMSSRSAPDDAVAPPADDSFTLWDLRVEVEAGERPMVCGHRVGDCFELSGENLTLPAGQPFSIYALAALLPLLPAKQRATDPHDWMTTDEAIACPDPNCGARFRIRRVRRRSFRHSEVTVVPLPGRKDDP